MLCEKQIERMLSKLKRFETILDPLLFETVAKVDNVSKYETTDRLHSVPYDKKWEKAEVGSKWGYEESFCWFKAEFTVPKELDGRDIYLKPNAQGQESLLFVNGLPYGTFNEKITFTGHGNHYCDLVKQNVKAGEVIEIAVEAYAGHLFKGCFPLEEAPPLDYTYTFGGFEICVKDEFIHEFYFDLKTINELCEVLDPSSFRRGDLVNTLYKVHTEVYYSVVDTDEAIFRQRLKDVHPYLKEVLAVKNGPEMGTAGLIGHSHMDTAWLWKVAETVKKCARTYSNQISLMDQYPEYTFVQSSACHGDMILKHYPALFEKIKEKVAEGRYEPNGGVWVECDCNITGGESMIRQFLWGQRFTRKHFGYTSNTFWLPDTFGYSAATPQIMKGCGVDYFCTTKIDANDTNIFPYDTFYWQGIDGTKVFVHFNRIHIWPAPKNIAEVVSMPFEKGKLPLKEKNVTKNRLISYGYGDGGGGPQFEMLEMSRRVADLNGIPKAKHTTVGQYIKKIEKEAVNPSTHRGELYFELHRGTLTNQHQIKHNNRKAEIALRDLEFLTVSNAVKNNEVAKDEKIHPLYEKLLLNQFHDILPGTCIPSAHKISLEETGWVLDNAARLIAEETKGKGDKISITNTLSFDRNDPIFIECDEGLVADVECKQQRYTNIHGKSVLILSGLKVPAFSTVSIILVKGEVADEKAFELKENNLETPFASVEFDEKGYISSFIDKESGRELRGDGYPLGTFLMAEDLPSAWDNWDIDADIEVKFADTSKLLSREVVSMGSVATVIRSEYSISEKSTLKQDMIFFADTKEVRFNTVMDWNDNHRLLKAAFDTSIQSDFARFEVQFGNVLRPTTRNNSIEKARFEVVNHKYTDLSETRFGVSILNDSKYGISAKGGSLRLSLHKGGNRPDFEGDHGIHSTVYSFLPHSGAFSSSAVIKPAYELNVPCVIGKGDFEAKALILAENDNIIVESIKPCEDNEKAFIARLYEAEGTSTLAKLKIFEGAKKVELTNMLEETQEEFVGDTIRFTPFEIKTFKVYY